MRPSTLLAQLIVLLLFAMVHSGVMAALEYIRFEGTVNPYYNPLGLNSEQNYYFDFAIDLKLEIENDDPYPIEDHPHYYAALIGGSFSGSASSLTFSTPAIDDDFRFIAFTLDAFPDRSFFMSQALDCYNNYHGECDNFFDYDLQVGDSVSFEFNINSIDPLGEFTVTYRGSEPPPPIPVPAALWLFTSAIACLFARRNKSV